MNPIFFIKNLIYKIERMQYIMCDMVEFMDNYDYFEDEDVKASDVTIAIRSGGKVKDYILDKILDEAVDCDYFLNEEIPYEEAKLIARFLCGGDKYREDN